MYREEKTKERGKKTGSRGVMLGKEISHKTFIHFIISQRVERRE